MLCHSTYFVTSSFFLIVNPELSYRFPQLLRQAKVFRVRLKEFQFWLNSQPTWLVPQFALQLNWCVSLTSLQTANWLGLLVLELGSIWPAVTKELHENASVSSEKQTRNSSLHSGAVMFHVILCVAPWSRNSWSRTSLGYQRKAKMTRNELTRTRKFSYHHVTAFQRIALLMRLIIYV